MGVQESIRLESPGIAGGLTIAEVLNARRSRRSFADGTISLRDAGQLLWAAQGVTSAGGFRTTPSAGALYPLEVLLVAGGIDTLPAGVYRYRPHSHDLVEIKKGDVRNRLASASLGQSWMQKAAAAVVIAAVYERTTGKYGQRGIRYVHMEAGHAVQNVYLAAESLGLATVVVGAFDDDAAHNVLGLGPKEVPLGILPVGIR